MECEKVLFDLVEPENFPDFNCRTLPLKKVEYILGPSIYYEFVLGDRKLSLFGEGHLPITRTERDPNMTPDNTLLFSSYVRSLALQNPDQTYDLMYEGLFFPSAGERFDTHSMSELGLRSNSPTMNSIGLEFFNCIFDAYREKCPYDNLRIHYVDFRYNKTTKQIVEKINNFNSIQDFVSKNDLPAFLLNVQSDLLKMLENPRIQKQFEAIKNKSLRSKLKNYFVSTFSSLRDRVMDELQSGENNIAFQMYLDATSLVLDMYAIPRILREFKVTKGRQFGGTSKNVLYYAGFVHISNLVCFFEEIGIYPTKKIVMPPFEHSYIKISPKTRRSKSPKSRSGSLTRVRRSKSPKVSRSRS